MKRTVRATVGVVALLMVAALAPITSAGAESAGTPSLFASAAEPRVVYEAPAHVARYRYVTTDLGVLFTADGRARNKAEVPEIAFDLFPGVSYTGAVTGVEKDGLNGSVSWKGDLSGVDNGFFYVTAVGGSVAVHIASPAGIFEASSAGNGLYRVIEIDQSKFEDHPASATLDRPGTGGEIIADGFLGDTADTGDVIDILVLYTGSARAGEGSDAAMKARVALAMTETNDAYERSGVTTRLRLVHTAEVTYTEALNLFTDLNNLRDGLAGLDVAHDLRDTFGADMIGLIIENAGGPYCGVAYDILASAANAVQVTARDCMTGYYSFGHEFGHLQGARHDTFVDTSTAPFTYGHGWTNPPDGWRTVMAYNNACAPGGCTRLPWWSNPNNNVDPGWGGDPTGGTDDNGYKTKNSRVLNTTAYTVANHRAQKIADDFGSNFDNNNKGWGAVFGTWQRNYKGWYWSKGKSDTVASARRVGQYGDVTYEASVKRVSPDCNHCANRLILRGKWKTLVFADNWAPSYLFQYDNLGKFSVYKIKPNGSEVALQGWTAHAAIKPGKWNKLKVVVVGGTMKFYINNVLVWEGTDSQLQTGHLGFGFYRNNIATKNRFMVDWVKVWNTPTAADLNPDEQVVPGTFVGGGSIDESS